MILNLEKLADLMVSRAKELAPDCQKVFLAGSGGIDSSLVAAILCRAFGSENIVVLHRNVRSAGKHYEDVLALQQVFGFKLLYVDLNPVYDQLLAQIKEQFIKNDLVWVEENSPEANSSGFTNAYASLKSRLTTPIAGFIAKAVDGGNGRIFGTGNGEEDGLLRYFDKYGDGAVDNNILNGLTKAEVRQLARHLGVPEQIITKTPSADLEASGDDHNDESQLTKWAHNLGFNINVSYGAADGSVEGNIAWGWKEDVARGVITGENSELTEEELREAPFNYNKEQAETILFLRAIEKNTRHKVAPIPGLERSFLLESGLVD